MKVETAKLNEPSPNYYAPLLTDHIKTILESGLLLDEDYEVLLNGSNFKIYPAKTATLPVGLIASGLTTLLSVFIAKRYNQPLVILPPLAATLVVFALKRRALLRERRRQEIARAVVKSFTRLRKVNTSILRYLKMRNSSKHTELLYNENVKEFVAIFVRKNISYFKWCLEQMSFLVGLSDDLSDDYQIAKEIDVDAILTADDDTHELMAAKIQDLNTFLVSKYLNYLGLILSRDLSLPLLELLLDKKLPAVTSTLDALSASVQKEFNDLRYCASKKVEIDAKSKTSSRQQLSGKLHQTLIGAVNNLSIIMEKSRSVLGKVEAIEEDKDFRELERALSDLRDHAYATYESLDILCRLYGILSDSKSLEGDDKKIATFKTEDSNIIANISYEDHNSEALEENYELYIPQAEEVEFIQPKEACEDQAGMYLNLMLKELKQSLSQHERFIAARNKRGIDDQTIDIPKKTIVIPKFDLQMPVPAPRASKLPEVSLPPPPPPPLPPPRLNLNDQNNEPKRTLFENVKNLSDQLKRQEDVFGDDCSSDSD